jgi:hypothetical protein
MHHVLLVLLSLWHCFKLAAPWLVIAFVPSVIVGLAQYPRRPGALRVFMRILNFASVLVHSDSRGTFKAPFMMSLPPSGRPPRDATCAALARRTLVVASMGPMACVMAVVAVLYAVAMRGCDARDCATVRPADAAATAPAPPLCDRDRNARPGA